VYANPLGLAALNDREALANLLDALEVAEEAARQLAYYTERNAWILVSKSFGDMRERCSQFAQRTI
jgi:hypothetical protein